MGTADIEKFVSLMTMGVLYYEHEHNNDSEVRTTPHKDKYSALNS